MEREATVPHSEAELLERLSRHTDRLSLVSLRRLERSVSDRIHTLVEAERAAALNEIEQRAAELGLRDSDIRAHFGSKRRESSKSGSPRAFKNPETGEIWAGKGRKPNWIKQFEESGGVLDDIATAPVKE